MAPVVPFIPTIASGIGALFGRKKNAAQQQLAALSGKQSAFGDTMSGMSTSNLTNVGNYLNPLVAGDPAALAKATASSSADIAKQVQQLTDRTMRGNQRGAATAMLVGNLPQQQMSAGIRNRIDAQQNAVQMLGNLGLGEGGLANTAYGGAAGSMNASGTIGLTQTAMDRNYYGGIGEGIWGILTGKSPTGQGTLLDKIIGIFKKGGGGMKDPVSGLPTTTA